MWQQLATIILLLCDSHHAAFLLGYTAESCDDLRPQRVPFVQDLMTNTGVIQAGLGANGLPINLPGFNRPNPNGPINSGPDGINLQPVLMTTVTPYRIVTSDSRYKRGRALEGSFFYLSDVLVHRVLCVLR